ncbi:hypothetical protein PV08_09018 [Exophiala spinifera]|uniref:Autophagy-related protein 16 domain-containing protein n=1 Tax=Exophiala spinifera TaxID=91928 RepID=A0A0D1Y9V5_9EURO|nr:uncharacterized protein PV08_09018 [Exophiala spinifera]KIW11746.1 hypothetical protein PV08_09018 [Exophiala spinifera]
MEIAKQHLFSKQLSKHSVGAYMELCREIGNSFEAIPQAVFAEGSSQGRHASHSRSILQLDAQTKALQTEKEKLSAELRQIQDQANAESVLRFQTEHKLSELEVDLSLMRDENARLSLMNEKLTKQTEQSDAERKKVLAVLYSLGPGPSSAILSYI